MFRRELLFCCLAIVCPQQSLALLSSSKHTSRLERWQLSERVSPDSSGSLKVPEPSKSNFVESLGGQATQRLGSSAKPTVWTEFSRLSQENDVVNLGQGFPDWLPPKFAVDSLVEAVLDSAKSPHQYTRPAGHPHLVEQLASRYGKHLNRKVDPFQEVAVTVGASQDRKSVV